MGLDLGMIGFGNDYSLDESWVMRVNGQSAFPSSDSAFKIFGISAPDQFGPGGPGAITVSFTSSVPATATLVDATGTGSPRTAQIVSNLYYTPTSGPAQGGVAFRPLVAGSTSVSASVPGFLTMTTSGNRVVGVQ